MVRGYLVKWGNKVVGNLNDCANPIHDEIDIISPNGALDLPTQNYWPSPAFSGLPINPLVLTIVHGRDLTAAIAQQLANLPGVQMIPVYRLDTLITDIPSNVVTGARTYLQNNGVPLSVFSGITTYFDFLQKIVKYFDAGHDLSAWLSRKNDFG